jgi:hypothetical protein
VNTKQIQEILLIRKELGKQTSTQNVNTLGEDKNHNYPFIFLHEFK